MDGNAIFCVLCATASHVAVCVCCYAYVHLLCGDVLMLADVDIDECRVP